MRAKVTERRSGTAGLAPAEERTPERIPGLPGLPEQASDRVEVPELLPPPTIRTPEPPFRDIRSAKKCRILHERENPSSAAKQAMVGDLRLSLCLTRDKLEACPCEARSRLGVSSSRSHRPSLSFPGQLAVLDPGGPLCVRAQAFAAVPLVVRVVAGEEADLLWQRKEPRS